MNLVQSSVYKVIYAILNNEEDAVEVFEEILYKAYVNLDNLKHNEYFKTWITRIAINEAKNYIKKNSKVIQMDEYEPKDEHEDSLDEKLDFENALNRLDLQLKSVIIMKLYLNFTFDEIAVSLDKPTGTIKTWYYKGLDCLKKLIGMQEEVTEYEQ